MTLITVTIGRGALVYHEGAAYGEGQTFTLPEANAQQLVQEGHATITAPPADAAPRSLTARKTTRTRKEQA